MALEAGDAGDADEADDDRPGSTSSRRRPPCRPCPGRGRRVAPRARRRRSPGSRSPSSVVVASASASAASKSGVRPSAGEARVVLASSSRSPMISIATSATASARAAASVATSALAAASAAAWIAANAASRSTSPSSADLAAREVVSRVGRPAIGGGGGLGVGLAELRSRSRSTASASVSAHRARRSATVSASPPRGLGLGGRLGLGRRLVDGDLVGRDRLGDRRLVLDLGRELDRVEDRHVVERRRLRAGSRPSWRSGSGRPRRGGARRTRPSRPRTPATRLLDRLDLALDHAGVLLDLGLEAALARGDLAPRSPRGSGRSRPWTTRGPRRRRRRPARRRSAASVAERPWICSTWVLASAWSWRQARVPGVLGGGLHRLREVGEELARLPAARATAPGRGADSVGGRAPARRSAPARAPAGVGLLDGRLGAPRLGGGVGRRPAGRSVGRAGRRPDRSRPVRSLDRSELHGSRKPALGVGLGHASCASPGDALGGPGRVRIVSSGGGCDGVR